MPDCWDPLRAAARRAPGHQALIAGTRVLTYDVLDRTVDRMTAALVARGVAPGDTVAVCLPLGAGTELITVLHAVPRAGATVVPLHPSWTAREMRRCVDIVGAKILIAREPLIEGMPRSLKILDPATVDAHVDPVARETTSRTASPWTDWGVHG